MVAKTDQLIRCARRDGKRIGNVLFYKHCHFPHHEKRVQQQQQPERIFKIITCVHGIQTTWDELCMYNAFLELVS